MNLTEAQKKAIEILRRDGTVVAGYYGRGMGRVHASTLRALAARGYGSLAISPDGGMMLRDRWPRAK